LPRPIGQRVSKGQLFATEVAPAAAAVLAADRAAIAADKSELAAALSGGTAAAIDAARAQLARDMGYQAVVTVLDQRQETPPSGMAANVQLGS
jgi:hypothetical protein